MNDTKGNGRSPGKVLPLWKVFPVLRGKAILAVVLTHAIVSYQGQVFQVGKGGTAGEAWLGMFRLPTPFWSILHELSSFAVPLFLFLSGHYLALSPHGRKAVWERVKKLLYPYLFWSFLAWGLSWKKGAGWGILPFLHMLLEGDAVPPFWFIVLLLQYYLLAPWIVDLVRKRPASTLAASAFLQFAVTGWNYYEALARNEAGYSLCFFPSLAFYLVLGIWAGLYPGRLKKILNRLAPPRLAVFLAVSFVLLVGETSFLANRMEGGGGPMRAMLFGYSHWKVFSFPFSVAAVFFLLDWNRRTGFNPSWLRAAGKNAFTIYLAHWFFLLALDVLYWHGLGPLRGTLAVIVLDFAAGVGGPLLLARLVRARLPWAGNFLLGD